MEHTIIHANNYSNTSFNKCRFQTVMYKHTYYYFLWHIIYPLIIYTHTHTYNSLFFSLVNYMCDMIS